MLFYYTIKMINYLKMKGGELCGRTSSLRLFSKKNSILHYEASPPACAGT